MSVCHILSHRACRIKVAPWISHELGFEMLKLCRVHPQLEPKIGVFLVTNGSERQITVIAFVVCCGLVRDQSIEQRKLREKPARWDKHFVNLRCRNV